MEEESSNESSNLGSNSSCSPSYALWPYMTWYFTVYFTGIIPILLIAFLQTLSSSIRHLITKIKNTLLFLLDRNKAIGLVNFILTAIGNIIYLGLMMHRSTRSVYNCNTRLDWKGIVELLICTYLLINCIATLFIARKPIWSWLSPHNLMDIVTLYHPFISLIFGYDWLGMRSLRFGCLSYIVEGLLKMIPWKRMRSQDVMKMSTVLCKFMGFWLASSGIIQLLENGGNFWDANSAEDPANDTMMSFWSSAYLAMITLSTVGYGDITVHSASGRVFILVFIVLGVVVYALLVPTFLEVLLEYNERRKFQQVYSGNNPLEHLLIVVGHITEESVSCFLKELLHPDKGDNKTFVIFLHVTCPTPNLCSTIKKYFTRVQYYRGSPLSTSDLKSCGIQHAKSVVVLANRQCSDPFAEDHSNLLMVTAIKKSRPTVAVILQLLNHHSKLFLSSLSGWDSTKDAVLCLNEWKMRTLAQTCITPGFCTLFSNLFFATGSNQRKKTGLSSWRQLYVAGACHEIYSTHFSHSFIGLSVTKAADIIYSELGLSLLTVNNGQRIINYDTLGYFMADQMSDVKTVSLYCFTCHRGNGKVSKMKACSCPRSQDSPLDSPPFSNGSQATLTSISTFPPPTPVATDLVTPSPPIEDMIDYSPLRIIPRSYTHSLPLSPPPATLNDHIVLCVFARDQSTSIGLASFLSPLQSSNVAVVIVSESEYIVSELSLMESTTGLYFLPGLPLISTSLKEAKVDTCRICVILSAPKKDQANQIFHGVEDKEVILCALTLRHQLGTRIRIISDLTVETHVHLLDTGDSQWDEPAYLANPFAFGEVFLSSVFNSLTTVIFHNPGIDHLLESLMLTGNSTTAGYKPTVIVITIGSTRYIGESYQVLYSDKTQENILCIGIHRQVTPGSHQRYIITAPPSHVTLLDDDIVLALSL